MGQGVQPDLGHVRRHTLMHTHLNTHTRTHAVNQQVGYNCCTAASELQRGLCTCLLLHQHPEQLVKEVNEAGDDVLRATEDKKQQIKQVIRRRQAELHESSCEKVDLNHRSPGGTTNVKILE